jgi:hypothetical protein
MKKILSLVFFAAIAVVANAQVELKPEVSDGNLLLKFENTSGKTIANFGCQLVFDEGVSIKLNKKGDKGQFAEGDATEGMSFSVAYKNGKFTVAVYDGEFDETAGNTIISLPLEGETAGKKVQISNISFGDPDANNICRPDDFQFDLDGTAINAISADQTKSGVIYNIAGQRVNKAQKGVFVVDGKKYVVK